ncbi:MULTISPECIES: glycosyltransferase [unclassified Lentimonas]|uniref:glycosyltransferase n=1 Tax=unclassified Lentimonas TaxID=2630993 RepID=UPI00132A4462|nr:MULTISPECIES: glycosyltransferase [unclassified Lentimonas]CAA6678231.1 Unannotated [Lentimonas sp. CC4]CAA6684873.1 Unannotated [Lentimonas sp. CC6]CAA7076772.1 Unannotated [Lentimonas sp. CC4]CAA7170830.1 Unannotated [Lentimonas sp. CC21]CAA7179607.1 Unannotated [Lentimonas sp. CC8]
MKTTSIILTVHNKEFMIEDVIRGIMDNVSEHTRELIVIFDGCSDRSRELFESTIDSYRAKDIKIITDETPDIWETKANNVGLKKSSCDGSIIIQDDMIMTEANFDQRLMKPINAFSDVFAVTGRTAHNDTIKDGDLDVYDHIGRENPTGTKPCHIVRKFRKHFKIKLKARRDIFGIRDVVNRGPLLIDNSRLQALNYFDEQFAPLDLDDHDLCFRAFKEHGWVCGSYQMEYRSDLEWGGTRMNSTSHNIWKKSYNKNKQILMDRHRDALMTEKHNENRVLA